MTICSFFGEKRTIRHESYSSESGAAPVEHAPPDFPEPLWDLGELSNGEGEISEPEAAMLVRFVSAGYAFYARTGRLPLVNGSNTFVAVPDLSPGDWIAVQEAGADAREFVAKADEILDKRGLQRGALERKMREWKTTLQTCLKRHGATVLSTAMAAQGTPGIGAGRIEAWAGPEVMAPREGAVFRSLLRATHSLGFFRDIPDIDAYAGVCWKAVQQLRDANRQGGRQVSDELAELLAKMLSERQLALGDSLSLAGDGRSFRVVEVMQVVDAGLVSRALFGRIRGEGDWRR